MKHKDYKELEEALREEVLALNGENRTWTTTEVSRRLTEIADALESIRQAPQEGIDASIGKRSGWKIDI
ncbi:MAG: hypothetical protein WC935_01005 [Thermoleophilia bacterium]